MKTFSAEEVAKHRTAESCWVILYGHVYDVTSFLPEHPGGSRIILQLAGKDATEDYDPIHPPGTLEDNLTPEAKLGLVDSSTIQSTSSNAQDPKSNGDRPVDLQGLLNLDEIEAVGTKNMTKKGWAYYYSAADDLITKHHNALAYRSILLRPRVFVDCSTCDTQTSFLGYKVATPIYVASAALARLAHPSGEVGLAKACETFGACQVIAQNASMRFEEIVANAPPDQVFGWQIYVQTDLEKSESMLARINALQPKIKFLVLTLDAPVPGKREDDIRAKETFDEAPVQAGIHDNRPEGEGAPQSGGIGARLFWGTNASLTWQTTLPWLAKHTNLPIVLKGIQTHEDAAMALRYPQVKGIVLSNHGGRALDTAPPAMHTLLEIRKYCPVVMTRLEVYVDGGIKRGTDVIKALCLGARGVGLGRAALWGLAAGGQQGVERTLQILQDELVTAMKLLGAGNIGQLGPWHVNTRALERDIYDGPASPADGRLQRLAKL